MKKFIIILLTLFLLIGMTACVPDKGDSLTCDKRFIVVENYDTGSELSNCILEDSETGVLYLLIYSYSSYRPYMALTVLLNSDGTPMIMEEAETDGK
jgi:hypothetical protein